MKTFYLIILSCLLQLSLFGQCCPYMDNFEISPEVPCANQNTQLLTTVTTPNLGQYYGYEIEQNGNSFTIRACYAQGLSTALETFDEVVDFGILPTGAYEYEYIAFLSESEVMTTEECISTAVTSNEVTGNFVVTQCVDPQPIAANWVNTPVSCYEENDGSIEVVVIGGVPPYQYAIDGTNFGDDSSFFDLAPGDYTITILDAVGTTATLENIVIDEAMQLIVDCGEDILLMPNEFYNITPAVNSIINLDSVFWTPTIGLSCTNCLETTASPPTDICYTISVINEDGCVATDEICFTLSTNVSEINSQSFQLFPNPVADILNIELNIEFANNYEIRILDIKSQMVFDQKFDNMVKRPQLNVSNMPNGIYLIQIVSNSLIYSQKFVKN